jgi:hypothetical protein
MVGLSIRQACERLSRRRTRMSALQSSRIQGTTKQKRTFATLHCEPVFDPVLKNDEPLQWFGNAKPLTKRQPHLFMKAVHTQYLSMNP